MVASVGKDDPADMYNYLGGVKNSTRSEDLDTAFKQDNSNFHIVIVVDTHNISHVLWYVREFAPIGSRLIGLYTIGRYIYGDGFVYVVKGALRYDGRIGGLWCYFFQTYTTGKCIVPYVINFLGNSDVW